MEYYLIKKGEQKRAVDEIDSRAFGSSTLGLPIVVARAHRFIAIVARRNTEAFGTAFLTEKHAWFTVLCSAASPCAL
ncbi:hypothetical protein SLA2020_175190 [Shorea laevis]